MMSVFENRDLVRTMLSHTSKATPLLASGKFMRDNEPCADTYEDWSDTGCPLQPTQDQKECLEAIGGHESTFCIGTYDLSTIHDGWVVQDQNASVTHVKSKVASYFQETQPNTTTSLSISFGGARIFLHHSTEGTHFTYSNNRQRHRSRCHNIQQVLEALVKVGKLPMPFPAQTLTIPKRIYVRLVRFHEGLQEEYLLLAAQRE